MPRRIVKNCVSKPEWDEEIREWDPARSVELCWVSAWWERGVLAQNLGRMRRLSTQGSNRVENMSLRKSKEGIYTGWE